MKKLSDLLLDIKFERILGPSEAGIDGIVIDSREAGPGKLFVALKGTRVDGHDFIPQVISAGCTAIAGMQVPASLPDGVTFIQLSDTARVAGQLASAFYDYPSRKLKLVGVTGTNGKTTIATLLYRLFQAAGYNCGLISTVENRLGDRIIPATHTTPDAIRLNQLLHEMVNQGCTHAFMEVSSHAVDQGRIAGQHFAGGIFTNLTHDHLDYHKTFSNYLAAKKAFFDGLSSRAFALSNADDRNGQVMLQNSRAAKYYYGLKTLCDFHTRVMELHLDGMLLNINGREAWFRLTGEFNAYNLTAIHAASVLLGMDANHSLELLSNIPPAEGRFDTMKNATGVTGIVDYAHTPDALKNVIETIHAIRRGNGRLITIVGAGGDRDKTKRPEMAAICARLSDKVILTSDNPRTEDPEQIIADMKAGLDPTQLRKVLVIVNRREAIRTAVAMADPGDVILVAGKGHEKYQEIQGVKYPFDDKIELAQALEIKND
ncbi:MAG: UDP-N-acetylmuramoyl-L-alanyl-D-glutamate--2,6-diaminopimelate ligase [Bacteroidales bacterium]